MAHLVKKMAAKRPNKNEALEALDFIINVLKEHEKDLDRLINELGKITGKFGQPGEVSNKIERVEERLSSIQGEVAGLIKELSSPKELTFQARGPPVIVRCKQWGETHKKKLHRGRDHRVLLFYHITKKIYI